MVSFCFSMVSSSKTSKGNKIGIDRYRINIHKKFSINDLVSSHLFQSSCIWLWIGILWDIFSFCKIFVTGNRIWKRKLYYWYKRKKKSLKDINYMSCFFLHLLLEKAITLINSSHLQNSFLEYNSFLLIH